MKTQKSYLKIKNSLIKETLKYCIFPEYFIEINSGKTGK